MLRAIFTLDYEIHGNGEGCPRALMVEPTGRLLRLFGEYGAKLTIMADVAEILKFREYQEQVGRDDYHYDAIVEQLRGAIRDGHDVQLHLHSSYFNARYEAGRWRQDWSEYNFAGLSAERLDQVVRLGKDFLETLLRPVAPGYRCSVFRAANWSVSPSRNVVRALLNNGFTIDTSVFKHGRREGLVNFDYSAAPSELVPWPVDEEDICRRNELGKLLEFPIYCEPRWIGAFLTPNRIHRVLMSRSHRLGDRAENGGPAGPIRPGQGFRAKLAVLTCKQAWKADFNQCTGRQLIRALRRAGRRYEASGEEILPFVLIGHSKLFTRSNERSLRPFLAHIAGCPERFGFGTFQPPAATRRDADSCAAGAC